MKDCTNIIVKLAKNQWNGLIFSSMLKFKLVKKWKKMNIKI